MCRGPCIRIALRQVISKLLTPLTGQFLVPHPSFSQHNGLVRGPRVAEFWWPEGGGEKVWEAAPRQRGHEHPGLLAICRAEGARPGGR